MEGAAPSAPARTACPAEAFSEGGRRALQETGCRDASRYQSDPFQGNVPRFAISILLLMLLTIFLSLLGSHFFPLIVILHQLCSLLGRHLLKFFIFSFQHLALFR